MTEVATLELVVKLKDQATRQLNTISGKFKSTGAKVTALAKKFTMLAGVAGIAAVGLAAKNAISTFTDFEKAIANAASVTGATGEVFEATKAHIEAVSRELGETTVFSASQAANAFYDLASAGYDVASMTKDELKPILDLAAATQNDLTKTTEVVTSTLGQFGLEMDSSGRIADVFAKTIGSSKATIEKLEYSLKYVGPVAKSMGIEIEEVNAILGQLYNAGFKGEEAGAALRGAFARLLSPTSQMIEVLEEMGLTLADVNPETHSFADILDTLTAAGMDTTKAFELFGLRGAPAITALVENTDGIRELESALSDAGGTAETMAEQQLDTLSGSIALLKSALEGVSITIGKTLAPYVRMLADWISAMIPVVMELGGELKTRLTPAFEKLGEFIKDTIQKAKELVKHFADELQPAFESVKNIVKILGEIFKTLTSDIGDNEAAFTTLISVLNTVTGVLNALAKFWEKILGFFAEHPTITKFALVIAAAIILIMNPVLAVIAALGVLAVAWDRDWLGIKTTTLEITAAISTEIEKFLKAIEKFWDDHGAAITKVVQFAWDVIKTNIEISIATIEAVITFWMALIKGDWEGAWNAIKEYVATVAEAITKLWDKWGDDIKTLFNGIWEDLKTKVSDWAKDVVSLITTWASDVLGVITGWVTDTIDAFKGWVRDLIGGSILTDWASDALKLFVNWAKDALGEITGWVADSISAFTAWVSDTLSTITGWYNSVVALFGKLKDIKITWPEIPNPFAKVKGWYDTAMAYISKIPGMGGVSGEVPEAPEEPEAPRVRVVTNLRKTSTGWAASGRRANATSWTGTARDLEDVSGRGAYMTQRAWDSLTPTQQESLSGVILGIATSAGAIVESFAKGGFVPYDMQADIHRGEFIVPAREVDEFMKGKKINITNTYNFGTVYGVDELQKLLDRRDRELVRKLGALI